MECRGRDWNRNGNRAVEQRGGGGAMHSVVRWSARKLQSNVQLGCHAPQCITRGGGVSEGGGGGGVLAGTPPLLRGSLYGRRRRRAKKRKSSWQRRRRLKVLAVIGRGGGGGGTPLLLRCTAGQTSRSKGDRTCELATGHKDRRTSTACCPPGGGEGGGSPHSCGHRNPNVGGGDRWFRGSLYPPPPPPKGPV